MSQTIASIGFVMPNPGKKAGRENALSVFEVYLLFLAVLTEAINNLRIVPH